MVNDRPAPHMVRATYFNCNDEQRGKVEQRYEWPNSYPHCLSRDLFIGHACMPRFPNWCGQRVHNWYIRNYPILPAAVVPS